MTSTSFTLNVKRKLPTRGERFTYELEQNKEGFWNISIYDRTNNEEEYIGNLLNFYSSALALEAAKNMTEYYKRDFKEELHRAETATTVLTNPPVITGGL